MALPWYLNPPGRTKVHTLRSYWLPHKYGFATKDNHIYTKRNQPLYNFFYCCQVCHKSNKITDVVDVRKEIISLNRCSHCGINGTDNKFMITEEVKNQYYLFCEKVN